MKAGRKPKARPYKKVLITVDELTHLKIQLKIKKKEMKGGFSGLIDKLLNEWLEK